MTKYLTIGEVAKLKNITIETLRHYDRIGLLKPSYVNPQTSYRYYDAHQILQLDIINYLKTIRISLNDIKDLFLKRDNDELLNFLSNQKLLIIDELAELEDALGKINKLQNRLTTCKDISEDYKLYEKFIDKRSIVYLDYNESPDKSHSILAYSKLNNYISSNNFMNLYEGGFIYNVENSKFQIKSIFELVKKILTALSLI